MKDLGKGVESGEHLRADKANNCRTVGRGGGGGGNGYGSSGAHGADGLVVVEEYA